MAANTPKTKKPLPAGGRVEVSGIKQEQPHSNPNLAVSFTRFESPEPLSKRFALDDGGKLVKTPAANMTQGSAVRVSLAFAAFGPALARASEHEAFGYGLHDAATHGEAVKLAIAAKAKPAKGVLARTRKYFDYRAEPGVLMIDHDPHPDGPAVTAEELRGVLAAVCPGFAGAAAWVRGSLSAGVHREGEAPKPGRGFHLYFAVADAADIPRFGKSLFKRLWLAGHGFIAVSSAGSFLVRAIIDNAVFDGERLDFAGRPVVGPGLAYTPPEAAYHAGGWLDTRSLPDLDEAEEEQLAALILQAKQAREADRRAQRATWEESHVRAMVERGVPEPEARAQTRHIPADGKPGDLYRDWPLEFATLGFATVGDALANPARYDGAALADPFEGVEYGRTTAKFFANVGGKPYINSHAHGGCKYFLKPTAGPVARPPEPPFDPAYCEQQLAGMREEGQALALPGPPSESPPTPKKPGKAGNQPGGGSPGKPGQAATQACDSSPEKPTKADGAKVVAMVEDNALRLALERKISEATDYGKLVYELAPDVNKSALRKSSKANLLKQIAKKANVPLGAIMQDLRDSGDLPEGRGRADAGFLPYEVKGNQIWLIDDQGGRPLCNFVASITEEVIHDNGVEAETLFLIEGCMHDGTRLPPAEVSASKFPGMSWVSAEWGARPLVHAGSSIKDHLRTAIQGIIPCDKRRTVYGHTGWRKLGEEWLFLHGGGGIGAEGCRANIEVRAGEGNMRRYVFDADGGGDLRADIRSSLRLLDISASNAALGVVLLASVYRAPLGEAAPIDHSVFLSGQTGSRKSEAAGLALAHFGRGFNARNFPANWDDTESDLEAKGHGAKDCVFVIDDFKPRGAANDVHKLHVKADRVLRAVGNQSGRGRRTSDMKQRAAYHPRGMVLSTGEDIPRGGSLAGRFALVEMGGGDVDNAILSELQESARSGALERAMGGFLRWLAHDMDEWKRALPGCLRALRDGAIREGFAKGAHSRAPDVYASLLVGLDMFFMFAVASGAVGEEEKAERFEACQGVLKDMIAAQGDLQANQDEVLQFLGFLKSSLNAGLCHFSDSLKQGAPAEHKSFWGWRAIPGGHEDAPEMLKPSGELVGWVDPVRVYLDGNAAFAAVQEMAKATGENLAITQRSLWTRMYERGLLLDVQKEAGKVRMSPKRTIAGVSRRVYVMGRKTIEDG